MKLIVQCATATARRVTTLARLIIIDATAHTFVQFAARLSTSISTSLIVAAWIINGNTEFVKSATAGRHYAMAQFAQNATVLALRQMEKNGHLCDNSTKENFVLSATVKDAKPATKKVTFC